jgi:hypothetical protein
MTDRGVLCPSCFRVWDLEQRKIQRVAEAQDATSLMKAGRLAGLHGLNWAVAFILFAGWFDVPGWLSGSLIAGVFALAIGMRLRSALALRAAMFLDTVGSVAFAVVSVILMRDMRLFFLLFPVVFAWWLAFLTWRARDAFAPPSRPGP